MKKMLFGYLCFFAFYVTDCQAQKSNELKKPAAGKFRRVARWPFGATSVVLSNLYDGSVDIGAASNKINHYSDVTNTRKKNTNYFLFNIDELLDNINRAQAIINPPSSIIQFILGDDEGNDLSFYTAVVDVNGEHFYHKKSGGNCNILGSLSSCRSCTGFTEPTPAIKTPALSTDPRVSNFYPEAMSSTNANALITNYRNDTRKNVTATSWLYNANDLKDYILKAQTLGATCVEFILAEASNTSPLQVIIAAVDNSSNQYFFTYNGQDCILENCNPCPTCDVTLGGASIELTCH